jgi:plasmid stability protein
MKRTQIYLEEDLDRRLRVAAAGEGRSAAHLIREAVRKFLAERRPASSKDPFLELAGSLRGGPRDGALEHDRDLYGSPARRRKR